MTTTPELPAADVDQVDQTLHHHNLRCAHVIAGILDAGLLAHVGRVDKLPTALFPDVDPDTFQAIWNMGVAVGVWGGKAMLRPQWDPSVLNGLQRQLADGAYEHMAGAVKTAASIGRHPADDGSVRGDHR